ncbi:MAG: hypothetical protein WBL29_10595 [Burkholderiales bacterium]
MRRLLLGVLLFLRRRFRRGLRGGRGLDRRVVVVDRVAAVAEEREGRARPAPLAFGQVAFSATMFSSTLSSPQVRMRWPSTSTMLVARKNSATNCRVASVESRLICCTSIQAFCQSSVRPTDGHLMMPSMNFGSGSWAGAGAGLAASDLVSAAGFGSCAYAPPAASAPSSSAAKRVRFMRVFYVAAGARVASTTPARMIAMPTAW